MAHSKSAKKRIVQSEKKRLQNRSMKSSLRTAIKKLSVTVASGNAEAAGALFHDVQRKIDKTAGKNVIRKGTADRMKSRLSAQLKKLTAAGK